MLVGPAEEREHALLCHPAQRLERGPHLLLREAHQQPVVLHADLIDGLAPALLQSPLHLCHQVLKAILRGVHQLQLFNRGGVLVTAWMQRQSHCPMP